MLETIKIIEQQPNKPTLGISSCLLGQKVRYNGGHSQSKMCLNSLSEHFDFDSFCPEVAAGFGTPRPTMRLVGDPSNPSLQFSKGDSTDLTQQLKNGFADRIEELAHLDGYILMKNSPSCGLERISVYQENGHPHKDKTSGIFTAALTEKYPNLPVEEEGRLHDPVLRENFILRVYVHHEFRKNVEAEPTTNKLMNFHAQYKYILMAHNQTMCKTLGRLVASSSKRDINDVSSEYKRLLMSTLSKPANSKNHTNVLLHLLGYLRGKVSGEARQKIADVIYQYHKGYIPLVAPIMLLKHYTEQIGNDYLSKQRYFAPYPNTLGLTNKI